MLVLFFSEKAMAPHSSTLAWKNPMDGGAWQAAVQGVTKSRTRLSDFTFTFHFHALEKEMATHSSVLAWRIPGMGEPGGLPSMGSHTVGNDWSDLAVAESPIRWPTDWRVLYQRIPCAVAKVLGPTTDSPTWGSGKGTGNPQGMWLWKPVGFDYRTSTELGKQTVGGHRQNFVCTRTQEKGGMTT